MELTAVYLYNRIPVEVKNISNKTFHNLKRHGWYNDTRTNKKFTMLNRRYMVGSTWYRALIRFSYEGLSVDAEETFSLSIPCPFLVTECEPFTADDGEQRWRDIKTYHGPKLKSVTGLLREGVPSDLVDFVYNDLKQYIIYN